jgi:two-component system phosphate regulon sensor histidine kinase PhoR
MSNQLNDQIDQLEVQRNELDAILRSMESGVIALDLSRRVLRLNKAARRLLGIWGEDARGRLLEEVTDQPALIEFVKHAMVQDGKVMDQFELYGASPTVVRVVKRSLMDAEERITGLVLIINDITRLKRLEGIRSDFAANVSHELRTPITNIKGYVETLRETTLENSDQFRNFLDVIDRNTSRLGAIVEDMLALTRIEQSGDTETLEHEPRQVAEIVRTVFSHLEPEARDREIELELDIEGQIAALVNSPLMEQAIMNLVSNAIKYTHPRTPVTVAVRRRHPEDQKHGEITIAVVDRGPGIAQEHLPRIFERFYRVDKARSRAVGGTGLGLAIVKHIAIVHGGRVDVQSEVGQGTTFTIILPDRKEAREPAA